MTDVPIVVAGAAGQQRLSARNRSAACRKALLGTTALVAVLLTLPHEAQAQTYIWGGTGSSTTTNDYNLGTNWSVPPAGAPPVAAGQSATFANTGTSAVTVTAGPITPDSWTFNANAQSYTISGAAVNFGLAGSTGGIIDNASAGQTITISNNIGESVAGVGVQVLGSSTLVLTGTNTYTGATTISLGATLQLGNGGATGSVAGNVVDNGLLRFNYSGPVTFGNNLSGTGNAEVVAGTVVVPGTSVVGAVTIDSGATLQWGNGAGGAFLIGAGNAVVDNGSLVMNFGGASGVVGAVPISGTGSVTIESGLFEELGAGTYTGVTTVNAGAKLQLGNGGSTVGSVAGSITDNGLVQFDYAGAGPVTAVNQISGTGNVEIVSGTTVFTGTSAVAGTVTIDSGATMQWGDGITGGAFLVGGGNAVVNNGALVMNFASGIVGALPLSGTGTLTLQSGLFEETGVATYTGATTIDSAGNLLLNGAGSISNSSNVIVNGIFDISGTAAGTSITTLNGSGSVNLGAQTLTLTAASGVFSGVMADGGAGGGLTIASGTETLTGTNTYTGATTINLGATLQLGNGGSTGSVAGNVVDNGLVQFNYTGGPVTAANAFSGGGSVELVAGTTVFTGGSAVAGNVTIDPGATMQWGAGAPAFLVGAGNTVIDNGSLVMNFGGGGIVGAIPISGTGTLTLQSGLFEETGVATYTGATTIDSAGNLLLNGAGSISNSSNVIVNGIFDISGTAAGTSITTLNGSGSVNLGAQTLTLTAASGVFSGVMADGGAGGGLTIASGTETLTGTNTYTGATTINLGATLQLGNGGSTGSVAGNVVDNGLVQFNYTGGPVTAANAFSGGGSVELVAGTTVFTGGSAVAGNVTIDPGATMQWGAGAPAFLVGAGNTVIDNGSLVMNFGGGGIVGAIPISGTGTLTLQSGLFEETGVATYTGATTIDSAGNLLLNGAGSISNSSNVIVNGIFDISGTAAGTSITTLNGSGSVNLGAQTLTLTAASGVFSGVMADGGAGGGLTIASGTETLTGTNTYTGATTINLGATLQLGNGGSTGSVAGNIVDSGKLIFDRSNTYSFAGTISGTGGVLQNGTGATILTATNLYTGATAVNGGMLVVDGSIALSTLTTVNAGGTLAGSGTVGSAQVEAGGTFAPGFPGTPGTSTSVNGSLAFASGALYLVQLNPATASLAIVSGTASLSGNLLATLSPGTYSTHQYDVLHAAGGLTGTFASASTTAGPGFAVMATYTATDVLLNLTAALGQTGGLGTNQQGVANAINGFFNGGNTLPPGFMNLFGISGTALNNALSQLDGEPATGAQQTTFDAMSQFMGLLTDPFISGRGNPISAGGSRTGYADETLAYAARNRTNAYAMFTKAPPAPSFEQRWSVWAAGYGGSQTTSGNAVLGSNDTRSSIYGTAVGVDYRLSPNTLAGFALAGGGTNFSVNTLGTGRSDLFQAGAYLRHTQGPAYVSAALAYGWQDVTTDRTVTIAGIDQLRARFNANAWSGRAEGGYRFVTPWMGVTPYAAAQFTTFDLPAYAEQAIVGANTFALAYGAKSVTDTRSELGIRTDKSFAMTNSILTLRGRFAWAHDFNPDRNIAATFQALPGASFVVNGAAQAPDSALTTASAEVRWMNGWSAAATFEGEFSNVTRSYAGKGVVRYAW